MILIIGIAYLLAVLGLLRHDRQKTAVALGLATLIGGLIYWTTPYSRAGGCSFWIAIGGLGLIAGFSIERWVHLVWPKTASVVGIGFVTSATLRMIYDIAHDPTTHNLFFIEVAFMFSIGFLGASVGVPIGHIGQGRKV